MHNDSPRTFIFHRFDESFHDSEAAMFTYGSITRFHIHTLTPFLESIAKEDGSFVQDDMPRCFSGLLE